MANSTQSRGQSSAAGNPEPSGSEIAPPPVPAEQAPETSPGTVESEGEGKGKLLQFNPSITRSGSHYHVSKTQLVEAGVPEDKVFTNEYQQELIIGPETGYKVSVELLHPAALERLLKESDLSLVEE